MVLFVLIILAIPVTLVLLGFASSYRKKLVDESEDVKIDDLFVLAPLVILSICVSILMEVAIQSIIVNNYYWGYGSYYSVYNFFSGFFATYNIFGCIIIYQDFLNDWNKKK